MLLFLKVILISTISLASLEPLPRASDVPSTGNTYSWSYTTEASIPPWTGSTWYYSTESGTPTWSYSTDSGTSVWTYSTGTGSPTWTYSTELSTSSWPYSTETSPPWTYSTWSDSTGSGTPSWIYSTDSTPGWSYSTASGTPIWTYSTDSYSTWPYSTERPSSWYYSTESGTPTWWYSTTGNYSTSTPFYPHTESTVCKNWRSSTQKDVENYGDLICTVQTNVFNFDELIIRDTIINYNDELSLSYYKKLDDVVITKVNVLNFGRQHGFTTSAVIRNDYRGVTLEGSVEVNIEVPSLEEVRLFVEVYGFKYYVK